MVYCLYGINMVKKMNKTITVAIKCIFIFLVVCVILVLIQNDIKYNKCIVTKNDTVIIRVVDRCYYNCREINCMNSLNLSIVDTAGNFDMKPIYINS